MTVVWSGFHRLSGKVLRVFSIKRLVFFSAMSLEEANEFVVVEVQEKEEANPGYRIRAVGMCFYRPGKDLVNGRRYKLHRSPQNPKDEWCIEIKEQQRVRATLNKDISQLLAPFLDENVTSDPTW